jgi:hypothetical protein
VGRFGGNDFRNAGRASAEAACQVFEVGELVVNGGGELDAALVVEAKSFLELGEHANAARDGESHAAEFTEELVPLLRGNSAATAEEIE